MYTVDWKRNKSDAMWSYYGSYPTKEKADEAASDLRKQGSPAKVNPGGRLKLV